MLIARFIALSSCSFDSYQRIFERIYRYELDAKARERMLLVLNVVYHGSMAARIARDLHRCKDWACEWLKDTMRRAWVD
jgi:adenylate cyclase